MLTNRERKSRNRLVAGVGIWFAAVVVASASGWLKTLPALVVGSMILAGIAVPTAIYFASSGLQELAAKTGIRAITVFHGWRILAGVGFLWYASRGLMPAGFALKAGWGDIVAGAVALLVAAFWARPAGYLVAHAVGLADFVIAVGTGMATTLANQPSMHATVELPGVLIPLFGVGITATTHFVALNLLWKERRTMVASQERGPVMAA